MSKQFISIAPAPSLVRTALAHCEIPLDYTDDHGVNIPAGPGWDSNGNMTIPEGHVLADILSAVITLAMEKHIADTMIVPSNVARIREVMRQLGDLIHFGIVERDDIPTVEEILEDLERVADNLDPKENS